MRNVLTPQAVNDIEEALNYYTEAGPELSARFLDDIDVAIARIEMFPQGSPPVEGYDGLRRARTRHFLFGLFYEQTEGGDLLVVRMLHSRRHHPDALEG